MEMRWANELREQFAAGVAVIFLLHGNVGDVFPFTEENGKISWVTLPNFLSRLAKASEKTVCQYDPTSGFSFPFKGDKGKALKTINTRSTIRGAEPIAEFPKSATKAFPLLEDLITDRTGATAVVLEYLEALAPAGDIANLGESQSTCLSLHRWAQNVTIQASNNIIFMIAESLTDINRKILAATSIASIRIPFPDEAMRLAFIKEHSDVPQNVSLSSFASMTSGLTLQQINHIIKTARVRKAPIDFTMVTARKKQIIEQECHGLVELIPTKYDFSLVGGMEGTKKALIRITNAVKAGHKNRVPMGMIFVGPMGTGKTFLAEAFAAESGLTCLKLKNFRDKWVGSTESNLEKVLTLVEALGNVLLIIDEADRALANNDDGVGSRVLARLKEFMSDTSHRGKIIILMMTNRPDKLDIDLKRPGRFDYKIPFFFPETAQEREDIIASVIRRGNMLIEDNLDIGKIAEMTEGYSAAELEQIVLAAISQLDSDSVDIITQENLDRAAHEIVPSRDTEMLKFMELLAVFEASSKSTLPERYAHMSDDEIKRNLELYRAIIGQRR